MRQPAEWMTALDDRILELLETSGLVLTPSIIAFNLDKTREGVANRINSLEEHGLVERVERGKYRITDMGRDYLDGELAVSELESTNEE